MSLQFAQPEGDDKTLCVDEWPFLRTEFCEVREWGKKRASCNNLIFGFVVKFVCSATKYRRAQHYVCYCFK